MPQPDHHLSVPAEGSISAVPSEVLARLGPSPKDFSRLGSSRVLEGNGLVLKAGPPDRAAREALVLGELVGSLPLRVPSLVDEGPGWLLLRSVHVVEEGDLAGWRARALADLARLHDSLAGAALLVDDRLRDVTGRELPTLLERSAQLAAHLDLPVPLRLLADDPAQLLAELSGSPTFVHGDAWPGNVLVTPDGGRCWIDWEEAGVGHAALDLANWLYGSPWVPPSSDPAGDLAVYLEARAIPIDEVGFRRAVEAAVVLLFLLLDLRGIAGWEEPERRDVTNRRSHIARQFAG